ncbi:MAG TPA: HAMP domain-containing sensor histidine kinase, partial [Candidatus Acidoferrum sp.]|nr:HAMP domain-containing sensor histidine kinase [Candidatus Acidoferrum sp.]
CAKKTDEKVRVWVEDNGIGIPPEQREKIFGLFQRLHGPEYAGTGVGLAIVKRATERMGGKVGFESEVGKGSRFWVELAGD